MSGNNRGSTLAFTLPISCQICLGKVKQPVVCPNQHVFCKVCMEFWLDQSQHCPACRIPITPDNPCRPVLGGLSQQNEQKPEFSTREMRRTRMEVLFKEYEGEIERLQRQNEILEEENKILGDSLSRQTADVTEQSMQQFATVDAGRFKVLSKKLKEVTDLYEQLKRDSKSMKEENHLLKEENGKLGIENQKLKMEVVSRSPRRFGRTTVLAMDSQLEKYKKENKALQKALEKTDSYIEDLEKHVQQYKDLAASKGMIRKASGDLLTTKNAEYFSKITKQKHQEEDSFLNSDDSTDFESKRLIRCKSENDTFELEVPSPITQSKSMSKLSIETNDDSFLKDGKKDIFDDTWDGKKDLFDETLESKDDTLELPSPVNSAKKRLKFSEPEWNSYTKRDRVSGNKSSAGTRSVGNSLRSVGNQPESLVNFNHNIQPVNSTSALITSDPLQSNPSLPSLIASTKVGSIFNSDLNTSMTPDIEDCMKLFEEAERKVEFRKSHIAVSTPGEFSLDRDNKSTNLHMSSVTNFLPGQRSSSHSGLSSLAGTSSLIAPESTKYSASLQLKQSEKGEGLTMTSWDSNITKHNQLFDPRKSQSSLCDFSGTATSTGMFTGMMPNGGLISGLTSGSSNKANNFEVPAYENVFRPSHKSVPFLSQSTSNLNHAGVSLNGGRGHNFVDNGAGNAVAAAFGRSLSQDFGASGYTHSNRSGDLGARKN